MLSLLEKEQDTSVPNPNTAAHQEHGLQPLHHGGGQLEQVGLHPLSVELGIMGLPDTVTDEVYQA